MSKIHAKTAILRRLFTIFAIFLSYHVSAQIHTVVTCPGEETNSQINISWAADTSCKSSFVLYTALTDSKLKNLKKVYPQSSLCTVFDSIYSKRADGSDFYENAIFYKCDAALTGLKKDTEYIYWIIPENGNGAATENTQGGLIKPEILQTLTSETGRRFKTSGAKEWSACIISDFHSYTPLPKRQEAATGMIDTICEYDGDIDWILHLGDITAWGGSYSFWKDLYENKYFKNYMWAGVNGNHDNMTRKYFLSNQFFKNANFYPRNGYEGEEGVCYFFRYGDVLFIMLNNENMRSDEGLQKAQEWVRKVIAENKSAYTVVCEHYQWFFGNDGKTSQYERWHQLFDETGVDLALAGNNHIYVRTNAIYKGTQSDGTKGTVYVQTPSSDNERGQGMDEKLSANKGLIEYRWTEGPKTVGALHLQVNKKEMKIVLINRFGEVLDSVKVLRKKK